MYKYIYIYTHHIYIPYKYVINQIEDKRKASTVKWTFVCGGTSSHSTLTIHSYYRYTLRKYNNK